MYELPSQSGGRQLSGTAKRVGSDSDTGCVVLRLAETTGYNQMDANQTETVVGRF